jgi:hypothetical protein
LAISVLIAAVSGTTEAWSATRPLYVSTKGSNTNPCTATAPCRTFNRAYRRAEPGQTVIVRGGTYRRQTIQPASKGAPRVMFRPAAGARVRVEGTVTVHGPHVEFRNMFFRHWRARYDVVDPSYASAEDLAFVKIHTRSFGVLSVQGLLIIGGSVGPNYDRALGSRGPEDGGFIGAWPTDRHLPTDILIQGVRFRKITRPTSSAHSDCVQFTAGVRVVIRNSRFQRCADQDLIIKGDQGAIDDFLIENSFFDDPTRGYFAINLGETSRGCRSVVIRYNSALAPIRSDQCADLIEANIQPSMSTTWCSAAKSAGVVLNWNIYESGVRCGPDDRVGRVSYRDRRTLDLHLRAGAIAIDRGAPTAFPMTDIDRQTRPRGSAPDAGADER